MNRSRSLSRSFQHFRSSGRAHVSSGTRAHDRQQSHWQHGAELHSPHYVTEPRLLCAAVGGCTGETPSPDSWEGWYYGGSLVWGHLGGKGHGMGTGPRAGFEEVMKHSKLIVSWANDPESQWWGPIFVRWVDELIAEKGIKWIFITPDCNWGAGLHATKWIPIRPGTDAALAIAIAYVWITEDTYDTEYVATHTYGFDHYKAYVLGEEDGVPKTPQWAEAICGVPSRVIKALAREWASKKTSIMHGNGGPMIRGPYAHEPGRGEVLLLAMQGVGKPGVQQVKMIEWGHAGDFPHPRPVVVPTTAAGYRGGRLELTESFIPKTLIPDAILNPPLSWYSIVFAYAPRQNQFVKYSFPLEGNPDIHMVWPETP